MRMAASVLYMFSPFSLIFINALVTSTIGSMIQQKLVVEISLSCLLEENM